jgi:3-hydroxybutyryl-CoA dehydrogenase
VYDEPAAGAGYLRVGGVHLALSDGRTATARASAEGIGSLVLFDLAHDFVSASRLAVVVADQADPDASLAAVGALQAAGIAVSRLDDVAGLIGLRTVCMLANEAADVVNTGVATAADVDAAMRHGAGYPEGPLAWADRLGCRFVAEVLDNLDRHYGDGRYRPSPLIGRRAAAGSPLANVLG